MVDLIAYLTARYDDEERIANAALWAGDERWEVLPGQELPFDRPWQVVDATYDEGLVVVWPHAADDAGVAGHVAYWQPLRVLAEVAAKRRILTYLVDLEDKALNSNWWNLDTDEPFKVLALPYASRDDFKPEWKP